MTSYKKVGGGLVQIILFNFWERMTNYKEGGASGLLSLFNFIEKSLLFKFFYRKKPWKSNLGVDLNIIIPLHPHPIFVIWILPESVQS